ncbi:hypothetical protein SPPR111872_21710 [Sphingobacterium prati]
MDGSLTCGMKNSGTPSGKLPYFIDTDFYFDESIDECFKIVNSLINFFHNIFLDRNFNSVN